MFVGTEAERYLEGGYKFYDLVYKNDAAKRTAAYLVHVRLLDYVNVIIFTTVYHNTSSLESISVNDPRYLLIPNKSRKTLLNIKFT